MRLRAMLEAPGGETEEGQEVRFRLRYRGKDKRPRFREIVAVLLPLSEAEQQQAEEAARKVDGRVLSEGQEYVVQLLGLSLRDPGNPAERLCAEARELQLLRDGLVAPQYKQLLDAYAALLRNEYPGVVTEEGAAEVEQQARDFSKGGQPGPG